MAQLAGVAPVSLALRGRQCPHQYSYYTSEETGASIPSAPDRLPRALPQTTSHMGRAEAQAGVRMCSLSGGPARSCGGHGLCSACSGWLSAGLTCVCLPPALLQEVLHPIFLPGQVVQGPREQAQGRGANLRAGLCPVGFLSLPSPWVSARPWGWSGCGNMGGKGAACRGRVVFSLPARSEGQPSLPLGHCGCLHTSRLPVDTRLPPPGQKVSTWERGCAGASKTGGSRSSQNPWKALLGWGWEAASPHPGRPKEKAEPVSLERGAGCRGACMGPSLREP